ncbi:MAG: B-box zinc finger protein, partial [Acidimicrobiia bacterium]
MTSSFEGASQPAAETVCYRHGDRPTSLGCAQCGKPICAECAVQG